MEALSLHVWSKTLKNRDKIHIVMHNIFQAKISHMNNVSDVMWFIIHFLLPYSGNKKYIYKI